MDIKFTQEYDRKMVEDAINNNDDPKMVRECINAMTEILAEPTRDVIKIFLSFKALLGDNDPHKYVAKSYLCSIIGNGAKIFDISDDELRQIVEQTITQINNIKNQRD